MKNREIDTKRVVYPLLAVLVTGVEYVWGLWHYGGLYRTGRLLSASSVSLENLKPMLCQHLLSIVPTLALAALVVLLLRGKTADVFGLRM